MLDFKVYLEEKAPMNPKPGDIWQTKGGFRGVNQSGNRQTFQDKEKTKVYVATKDASKDEPKKDKKEPLYKSGRYSSIFFRKSAAYFLSQNL